MDNLDSLMNGLEISNWQKQSGNYTSTDDYDLTTSSLRYEKEGFQLDFTREIREGSEILDNSANDNEHDRETEITSYKIEVTDEVKGPENNIATSVYRTASRTVVTDYIEDDDCNMQPMRPQISYDNKALFKRLQQYYETLEAQLDTQ